MSYCFLFKSSISRFVHTLLGPGYAFFRVVLPSCIPVIPVPSSPYHPPHMHAYKLLQTFPSAESQRTNHPPSILLNSCCNWRLSSISADNGEAPGLASAGHRCGRM